MLPGTYVKFSGVAVRRVRKFGDGIAERFLDVTYPKDRPDYEAGVVEGLRRSVLPGDRVVVVGGGLGVTVVLAAKLASPNSSVTCFEGGKKQCDLVRDTILLNKVSHCVKLEHACVAKADHVYGDSSQARTISPDALPDCDVLELDCEGAEIEILQFMTITPRVVIVETHGLYGAPTHEVVSILKARGYDVVDLGYAEPSMLESCQVNDVRVLVGVINQARSRPH